MTTTLDTDKPNMRVVGARAVLLGGCCAIGVNCFFSAVVAGLWLRITVLSGVPPEQAFASLMAGWGSPSYWLMLLPQLFGGAAGGYIAARGGKRPIPYALLSGLVYLVFYGSMYLNPSSQLPPLWYFIISLFVPLASAMLGGFLYERRT